MIALYHAGNTALVRGVRCEQMIVSEKGFEHYLEAGWHLEPCNCYPKEEAKVDEAPVVVKKAPEKEKPVTAVPKVTSSGSEASEKTPKALKPSKTTASSGSSGKK